MIIRKRATCVLVFLVLTLSMATVVVSAPAASAPGANAMDKLAPELRAEFSGLVNAAPDTELRTIVFLAQGANEVLAGSSLSKNGAEITAAYPTLGAFAVTLTVSSVLKVASIEAVERMLIDSKRQNVPVPAGDAISDLEKLYDPDSGMWYASTPYTMGADKVWDMGVTGEGVKVAVLDTGADIYQRDLADAIFDYKSFTSEAFHDVYGHGTSTAGLIASRAVNTYYGFVKVQGIAPGAMIMAGKVLGDDGSGWDSWIIAGIEWAVVGSDGILGTGDEAQIISMSLGGLEVPNDGDDPTSLALDRAAEAGVVSFVAAGNEGLGRGTVGSPGVSARTITVGASTNNAEGYYHEGYWPFTDSWGNYLAQDYENNHMMWWSSRGPTADGRIDPDLAAVGAWGPAPTPGDMVDLAFGGTSMATPVAAGVGALVYEAFMEANGRAPAPAEMKSILMSTAMDMGYGPAEQGAGRVDALKSYEAAVGARPYSAINSVAVTLAPGTSTKVSFGSGTVSSRVFQEVSAFQTSGYVYINGDWFYQFDVPAGVSYLHIDLAFDQKYAFSKDVHVFKGVGYTDDHLNIVLYKLEEGGRTMVNYAYDHTNTQELNAKVVPGSYELRVWGAQYKNKMIPFDLNFEFYKTAAWAWVSTRGPSATISVPTDAQPGTHVAYLQVTKGKTQMLVPVAVTVPMTLGMPASGAIEVGHGIWSSMEGDWIYYQVHVPEGADALTVLLTWLDWNTDIDTYLIDPEGNVVVASFTNYIGEGLFGPWSTSTGTTADMLTFETPEAGMWMIALHDVFLGKVFDAPYELTATLCSPVTFGDTSIEITAPVKMTGSAQTSITNSLAYPVYVGLAPIKNILAYSTVEITDELTSSDLGGPSDAEILFTVAPATEVLELTIEWPDTDADIDVVVYAPDGADRGILWESGDMLTIEKPVAGVWEAAVALKNTAYAVEFTLTEVFGAYPAWSNIKLDWTGAWLAPGETVPLVVSGKAPTRGTWEGTVLAYDGMTGCVLDRLAVTLVVG
jgi:subtilisin family serine protease